MADDIDRMQEREAMFHDALIAVRKPEGPKATGHCLTCEEPVEANRRWCDADCRDDFDRGFPNQRR